MRKKGETFSEKQVLKERNKDKKQNKFHRVFNKKGLSLVILLLFILIVSSASIYFNLSGSSEQNKTRSQSGEKSEQGDRENSSDIREVADNSQSTDSNVSVGNKEETENNSNQAGNSEELNDLENHKEDSAGKNSNNSRENNTENTIDLNNSASSNSNEKNPDTTNGSENHSDTNNSNDSTGKNNNGQDITNSGNVTGEDSDSTIEAQETFGQKNQKAVKVRGIYVSGPRAGSDTYMKDLVDLVDTTELNAMVIDIKNDLGEVTYNMDNDTVKELKANRNYIKNIKELVAELKEKDIYLIARIVAFKDPILAEGKPELSIKIKDGSIFRDKNGDSWVNPYNKEVWEYLVSIGKEAAELGFDEIQFDYIRFSTDSGIKNADFGKSAKGKTKVDAITEFTKYACENLKPLGVYVSADVFGTIIDSETDAKIVGQDYKEMAKYLDYICPMIYPSHYQDGSYGIKHPDLEPYQLIYKALEKSQEVLGTSEGDSEQAEVRSWLQDFTATWLDSHKTYGEQEIKDQIQAVYDAGYDEWILWNGSNNYTKEGLMIEE